MITLQFTESEAKTIANSSGTFLSILIKQLSPKQSSTKADEIMDMIKNGDGLISTVMDIRDKYTVFELRESFPSHKFREVKNGIAHLSDIREFVKTVKN